MRHDLMILGLHLISVGKGSKVEAQKSVAYMRGGVFFLKKIFWIRQFSFQQKISISYIGFSHWVNSK